MGSETPQPHPNQPTHTEPQTQVVLTTATQCGRAEAERKARALSSNMAMMLRRAAASPNGASVFGWHSQACALERLGLVNRTTDRRGNPIVVATEQGHKANECRRTLRMFPYNTHNHR